MAETQRPIISGETDAERAAARARYEAREREVRNLMDSPESHKAPEPRPERLRRR